MKPHDGPLDAIPMAAATVAALMAAYSMAAEMAMAAAKYELWRISVGVGRAYGTTISHEK